MIRSGIYAIRNVTNGRCYIGSAVDLARRWREHRRTLKVGGHSSPMLQSSWLKNGQDAFVFEVLEAVTVEVLLRREQFWIDYLQPYYNVARCALAPMSGRRHSEATKAKMSAIARADGRGGKVGRVVSEETRAKLSVASCGNKSACGCVRSEEVRAKLRGNKHSVGHRHSAETRARMSATRIGRLHPVRLDPAKAQQRREAGAKAAAARWAVAS